MHCATPEILIRFSTLFHSIFQSFDGKTWWIPYLVCSLFWSDTAANARCSGSCNQNSSQKWKRYEKGWYHLVTLNQVLVYYLLWNKWCQTSHSNKYHKVASSRPFYYSILESFGQRSEYISIKFPLHKESENPWTCY